MPDPQDAEQGYTQIPHALMIALSRTNLTAYESRVIWFVLRKTYGWHKRSDSIPLKQIADATGLSKSHCSRAISRLVQKGILKKDQYRQIGVREDYRAPLPNEATKLPNEATKLPNEATKLPNEATGYTEGVPIQVIGGAYSGNPPVPEGGASTGTSKDIKDTISKDKEEEYEENRIWIEVIKEKDVKTITKTKLIEHIQGLREKYTDIDFNHELEKFRLYYSDNTRKLQKPRLALTNWMDKATRDRGGNTHATHQRTNGPSKRRPTGDDIY